MTYHEQTYTIITCSNDKEKSVVLFNVKERQETYIFKVPQGATCFSFNYKLHLLMSGNNQGLIQLWNIYVPDNVLTNLKGHKTGIVDVNIFGYRRIAISCSTDGIIKVWDLENYNCIQTLSLKYPCFNIMGKLIEWGISSIYPGPKRNTGNDENDKNLTDIDSELEAKFSIYEKFQEDPWVRSVVLISCCNYVGKITISDNFDNDYDKLPMLPPPPLQSDVMIPPNWKIGNFGENIQARESESFEKNIDENFEKDTKENINNDIEKIIEKDVEKDIEENIQKDIEDDVQKDIEEVTQKDIEGTIQNDIEEDIQNDIEENIQKDIEEDIQKDIEEDIISEAQREFEDESEEIEDDLSKYLLKKEYLQHMGFDLDVNKKLNLMKEKLATMRSVIAEGAPYIAMDLFELEEITLSPNLPVPGSKKAQQYAERTQRLLSAASTRSGILSDRSSKSRSSRSSIVEF